jgi:uncharacterized membrane protein
MNSNIVTKSKAKGISADTLKWIAMITMFIDHIGAVVIEYIPQFELPAVKAAYYVMRYIGRLAFPLYCFLLVEGYIHTGNQMRYLRDLLIFAAISEIPFEICFMTEVGTGFHNVFWTLAIGLAVMMALDYAKKNRFANNTWINLIVMIIGAFVAEYLGCDYGAIGVLLIFILYQTRSDRAKQSIFGGIAMLYEVTGPIAFVLTYFYNGERKIKKYKYAFYAFYPVHILLLYLIRCILL